MLFDNLGKKHFTDSDFEHIHTQLDELLTTLGSYTVFLNADNRRKFAKVREQNKLLINKVKDFHESMPRLQSPDVDWEEFQKDYRNRTQASGMLHKIKSLEEMVYDIKILHDYDNYTAALRDYQYAKYMTRFADDSGYALKIEEMKGFFPKTGKTKKK